MITLQSIMNFERGQTVMLNPDNPGERLTLDRKGKVVSIFVNQIANSNGAAEYIRTGNLEIMWEGNKRPKIENYKILKIV